MAKNELSPKSDSKKGKPDEWEINNWKRTVIEAHEIMCDPKKMKYVKESLKKEKKAIRSVDDLIAYRNDKFGSGSGDDYDEEED